MQYGYIIKLYHMATFIARGFFERSVDLRDKPELLAPAGSYEALLAAIEAKADAVYLGGEFNARAFARNFDREKIKEAISLCHTYGVKVYVTLNTLVFDREIPQWLEYAEYLWMSGADAFIVADLGAAALLKKYIGDVRLHASTQMTVHNSEGVRALLALGFERVVVAREITKENIASIVQSTGAEIEIFVHGALCVSVSGQCLLSSLVGGRSGNRGECAQPCRMLYNKKPLLSLKDNCLASHITEILSLGVSSLKIEGRMKSPEYVYGVVSSYRELLEKARNATKAEIGELERLFCRSGFTDGYFIGKTDGMCGVRTDADKKKSEDITPFSGLTRKIPISIDCEIKEGVPMRVTVHSDTASGTATGNIPQRAECAPIDTESVKKSLCKLGGTPFVCENVNISLSDGLYAKVSELNALRREAINSYMKSKDKATACRTKPDTDLLGLLGKTETCQNGLGSSARFISSRQLRESNVSSADFARIYLPLDDFSPDSGANGVVLPPLVYDSEWDGFVSELKKAKESGADFAVCSNISQIKAAADMGFTVTADLRLNCTNQYTADILLALGAVEIILSPELKIGGMRDIRAPKSVIVYGKLPVMLTQKCPVKEAGGCDSCRSKKAFYLTDRTGAKFFVFGDALHRAVIYNSVPIYTADTQKEISRIGEFAPHFIFSDESGEEINRVLRSYGEKLAPTGKYRRI